MFDNIQSSRVVEATEQDILAALGEEPTSEKTKDEKSSTKSKDTTDSGSKKDVSASDVSDDDLEIALGNDDSNSDNEEDQNDSEDDGEDDGEDADKKAKKDDEKTSSLETDDDVKAFLKARVNFLVEKGEWQPFEGIEEVEWDEETFAEIELKQREFTRQMMRDELLDSFGPYGKQIAEYSANGGDPDDLIDIFKEQIQVQNFSIDTEEQQRELVYKYETEFLGKKPERVTKYINTLIADKELADEASAAKEAMESKLKEKAEEIQKAQLDTIEQEKEKQRRIVKDFSDSVSSYLNSSKEISTKEKQEIINVLTKFDKKLKNGTPVNEFYFKFAEFKKNLPDYIELVRFVLNPKGYKKAAITEGKNAATEKSFKLIRTGQKTKSAKGTVPDSNSNPKTTKFKLL
jgi:hypothetical protein